MRVETLAYRLTMRRILQTSKYFWKLCSVFSYYFVRIALFYFIIHLFIFFAKDDWKKKTMKLLFLPGRQGENKIYPALTLAHMKALWYNLCPTSRRPRISNWQRPRQPFFFIKLGIIFPCWQLLKATHSYIIWRIAGYCCFMNTHNDCEKI